MWWCSCVAYRCSINDSQRCARNGYRDVYGWLGAGWQGFRKQQRQRELDNCKKVVRARSAATAPSLDRGARKGSYIATVTLDASLRSWMTLLPSNL